MPRCSSLRWQWLVLPSCLADTTHERSPVYVASAARGGPTLIDCLEVSKVRSRQIRHS